jgi:D-sedoheptulose 7-phosphate isomerase
LALPVLYEHARRSEEVNKALDMIGEHAREGIAARELFFKTKAVKLRDAAIIMAVCLAQKGKILLCGNGGSAADAQHVAAEFVNRFMLERPPLSAIALSTDSSILTAIGNDYDFDQIFSKQVLALGSRGDVLVAISTSGNSANIVKAIEASRVREMRVIGLTGKSGGKIAPLCDIALNVEHHSTPVIQEVHLAAEHLLCLLCDYFLFENVQALLPFLKGSD